MTVGAFQVGPFQLAYQQEVGVLVPDVVGTLQLDGTNTLEGDGFVVSANFEYSATVSAGTITRQDPTAGSLASSGSIVSIWVSLGPQPSAGGGGSGGAGGSLWYDRKKQDKKLKRLLDDVVAEVMYRDLIKSPDAKKAAAIVKPFAETKQVAIPRPEVINWEAIEQDAAKMRQLVALWNKQQQQIEDEEFWFLMGE
tara:strand:- start:5122 stop:5709 length:588 start_codon:yes stop_codon:yes gene_type:complete